LENSEWNGEIEVNGTLELNKPSRPVVEGDEEGDEEDEGDEGDEGDDASPPAAGSLADIWEDAWRHTRPWYNHGCAAIAERLTPEQHKQKFPAWIARQIIYDRLSWCYGRRPNGVWVVPAKELKDLVCAIRRVEPTKKARRTSRLYLEQVLVPLGLLTIEHLPDQRWRVSIASWEQWWGYVFGDGTPFDARDMRAYCRMASMASIRAWGVILPRKRDLEGREWISYVRGTLVAEATAAICNGGADTYPLGSNKQQRAQAIKDGARTVRNHPDAIEEAREEVEDDFLRKYKPLCQHRQSWPCSNERLAHLLGWSVSKFKRLVRPQVTVRRVPQSVVFGQPLKGKQVEPVRKVFRANGKRPPRMQPQRHQRNGWYTGARWRMQFDLPNRWEQRPYYRNWAWEPVPEHLWLLGGPSEHPKNQRPVRRTVVNSNVWWPARFLWEPWGPRHVTVSPSPIVLTTIPHMSVPIKQQLRALGVTHPHDDRRGLGRVVTHPPRGTHQPPLTKLWTNESHTKQWKHWDRESTMERNREHWTTKRNRKARERAELRAYLADDTLFGAPTGSAASRRYRKQNHGHGRGGVLLLHGCP